MSDTTGFRAEYRAANIPAWYRGWAHFMLTTVASLAAIAFAVSRVAAPSWKELLAFPATFLFANLGEYLGHRGPMHHLTRLSILYRRHSKQHHRFFTHEAMEADSARDFHMVLFPPMMFVFFLGMLATPIGALLFVVSTSNIAWIFVATAVGYFLTYEWLHFAYHLPEDSWVGRLPGMRQLRRAHTMHHDPALMRRCNFNITFPICDLVFGTYRGEPEREPARGSLERRSLEPQRRSL